MRFSRLCVLLLGLTLAAHAADRALPLHRFDASRAAQTDAAGFYFMPTGVGDDYFDGTSSRARVRRHLKVARETGARYLRCAFSWDATEKSHGHYDWKFWDMLVSEAEKAGIELIPYVAYTPQWAAAKSEEFWKQPPRDPRLYADFMYEPASRYRGRVRSWELWNEPDLTEYWQGSIEQFAEMVKLAADAVRRADPAAVLVLAGVSWGPSAFFRELIETYHLDRYVDVVATHGYPESWHPQRSEQIYGEWLPEMAGIIKDSGAGVDFWANEMGYPDYRYAPAQATRWTNTRVYFRYEHTREFAATELFKGYVMALASGDVSLMSWYRIDDFPASETRLGPDGVHYHLGLVDTRGRPKPAFFALKFFNRLFDQPTRTQHDGWRSSAGAGSEAVVNVIEKKDGELVVAAWLRDARDGQVADQSGMAEDRRRETVAVQLPCVTVEHARYFDAEGRAAKEPAKFASGWMQAIPLSDGQVFVAEFACRKN